MSDNNEQRAINRLFGAPLYFTGGEVIAYLLSEGWEQSEVDLLIEEHGYDTRTEDEWYAAIAEFKKAHPA